jgi:hypothetical protein
VFAQAMSSNGTIYACVYPKDGTIRIVSGPTSCKKTERLLSWNIMGPKGDKGDPDPAGGQIPRWNDLSRHIFSRRLASNISHAILCPSLGSFTKL